MPRKCCVPGCKPIEDDSVPMRLFAFPRNADLRERWTRSMPKNFQLKKTSFVCVRHFIPDFVIKEDQFPCADGSLISLPRKKLKLREDAYPTIFDYQPSVVPKKSSRKGNICKLPAERFTPDESNNIKWNGLNNEIIPKMLEEDSLSNSLCHGTTNISPVVDPEELIIHNDLDLENLKSDIDIVENIYSDLENSYYDYGFDSNGDNDNYHNLDNHKRDSGSIGEPFPPDENEEYLKQLSNPKDHGSDFIIDKSQVFKAENEIFNTNENDNCNDNYDVSHNKSVYSSIVEFARPSEPSETDLGNNLDPLEQNSVIGEENKVDKSGNDYYFYYHGESNNDNYNEKYYQSDIDQPGNGLIVQNLPPVESEDSDLENNCEGEKDGSNRIYDRSSSVNNKNVEDIHISDCIGEK